MKTTQLTLLLITILLASQALRAQERWSIELRPGINFPTTEIAKSELNTGFGAELTFGYRFMDHLGAYVGWGWNRFVQENPLGDTDVEMTGYTFGLNFTHPINESSFAYMLRGGAIYNHLEMENKEGEITQDTGHGFGWEAGLGLQWSLTETWKLTPQVGYRMLQRDMDVDGLKTDVELNYFSASLGISKLF